MTLDELKAILFWCLVVNLCIYVFTVIAVVGFRERVCRIQTRVMGIDEATALKALYNYVATYKLLIIVFNFAPWIALMIITSE